MDESLRHEQRKKQLCRYRVTIRAVITIAVLATLCSMGGCFWGHSIVDPRWALRTETQIVWFEGACGNLEVAYVDSSVAGLPVTVMVSRYGREGGENSCKICLDLAVRPSDTPMKISLNPDSVALQIDGETALMEGTDTWREDWPEHTEWAFVEFTVPEDICNRTTGIARLRSLEVLINLHGFLEYDGRLIDIEPIRGYLDTLPRRTPEFFSLDQDCPGEEYVYAIEAGHRFPDTAGIGFWSTLYQFSGPYNYSSSLEFNAPSGVSPSLLFYKLPQEDEGIECVGRARWYTEDSTRLLRLPLAAVYDRWGFHDYIVLLLFDDEPRLKWFMWGRREVIGG